MRDIFENVACVGFTVGFAVGFAVTASALVGVLVTLGTHFCVHAATCAPLTFTADLDAFPMVMIDSVCTRDTTRCLRNVLHQADGRRTLAWGLGAAFQECNCVHENLPVPNSSEDAHVHNARINCSRRAKNDVNRRDTLFGQCPHFVLHLLKHEYLR